MQIKQISIFHEFQCTGADCSVNCCRGWKVPIDHDMYMKYLGEKGVFGTLLRCSIEKKEELVAFRSTFRGCPFWGLDRLCAMQKKHGTDYMPAVCIQFPRQLYNLDFFCEETLYLACPEAARLFLVSVFEDRPFGFTVTEGSAGYAVNTTNDDGEFLQYLLKSRDELVSMLRDGTRFDSMAILDYGRGAQNACLSGSALPSPLDYQSEERFAIGLEQMDKLFYHGFYHPSLKTLSPFLYQLCRKYIRKFGVLRRLNPDAAEKRFSALMQSPESGREERTFPARRAGCMLRRQRTSFDAPVYGKIPDLEKLLNRYFEYYLFTNFLDIFEDYSFSKHLLFGIAKTDMLRLFLALYAEHRTHVSIEEIAKVIAVYERRAPQIEGALAHLSRTNISRPNSTNISSVTGPRITPPTP